VAADRSSLLVGPSVSSLPITVWRRRSATLTSALTVMRRADHPNLGFVFNSQFRIKTPEGWSAPDPSQPAAKRSIASLWEEISPYLCNVHTHQMERPDQLPLYQELFRLLKADGWNGYVAMEGAYTGPDPAKVLRLYTTLFQSFTS